MRTRVATGRRHPRYGVLAVACGLAAACGGSDLVLPSEGDPAAIAVVSGDHQTGPVGTLLPDSLVIRVSDTRDRPVQGARAVFSLGDGAAGGRVVPDTVETDAGGRAAAVWLLGSRAGTQKVEVRVLAGPLGLGAEFSATATPGAAAKLTVVSGDRQQAPAGTELPQPLVVAMTDAAGNPIAGAVIAWTVSGGGSANPRESATDGSGRASTRRTLGPAAGVQTTIASAKSLSSSPVTFTHTATAGSAARISIVSGDRQSAPAGSRLPNPLVVQVLDANGNPIAGTAVSWVVGQGGGTADPASSTTAANGRASTTFTLGKTPGTNTVSAVVSGVGVVTFTATGTAGPAARIEPVSGDGQTAPAGSKLPNPLVVRVSDAGGNPVAGVTVSWAVASGGGSLSSGSTATGSDGRAQVTWTLGSQAGTQSATASVSGLSGSPVRFTATATAPPPPPPPPSPSTISKVSGDSQSAPAGSKLPNPLVVQVTNNDGSPAAGVQVTWQVQSGGGSLSASATTTGSDGRAQVEWTLGPETGTQTATASASGLSGSPVSFTATATAPPSPSATQLGFLTQPQNGKVGQPLQPPVQVAVEDAPGHLVPGSTATVTVALGRHADRAVLSGTLVKPAVNGVATFDDLTIDREGKDYTLLATSEGLASAESRRFRVED